MSISRRRFLQGAGAALVSINAASCFGRGLGQGTKVLVIGGGPAGLCAAHELVKSGCEVIVFEARTVPGGRIMTLREPFDDGLHAEAGAMILASSVIERYVDEFSLPIVPANLDAMRSRPHYVRGQLVTGSPDEDIEWPLDLPAGDQSLSYDEIAAKYYRGPVSQAIDGLTFDDFPFSGLAEYDRVSLADFMRTQGATDDAVELISLGYLDQVGDGPDSYSALSAMAESALFAGLDFGGGPFQIQGGNDLLPAAFADRLGSRLRLGSPVMALSQDEDRVHVTVDGPTGRYAEEGDYVVCAAPFPVLRDMEFPRGMSERRRNAFAALETTSITRIFLQFREQFWTSAGRHPGARTDLPIQGIVPTTINQAGARGILEAFTGGAKARYFDDLSDAEAIETTLEHLTSVHPEARDFYESGRVVRWDKEPWLFGCQVYFKPGQMHELFPYIAQPEGRVYFAGDHIGGVPGYSISALLSAQKAASDVLAAIG